MATETRQYYDAYWGGRQRERTAARSRERALATLALLDLSHGNSTERARGRLLDIGCGPGWALELFDAAGYAVAGVDASTVACEAARERGFSVREVDLETDDSLTFSVDGEPPDFLVALEVLEHLKDPLSLLRRLLRRVSDGGGLVVSLPNEIHLLARLKMVCGRLPFGGHADPHIRHFDRANALALFDAAEARVVASRAIPLLPPRWSLLRRVLQPLAHWLPGLFSIASVFLLEPRKQTRP